MPDKDTDVEEEKSDDRNLAVQQPDTAENLLGAPLATETQGTVAHAGDLVLLANERILTFAAPQFAPAQTLPAASPASMNGITNAQMQEYIRAYIVDPEGAAVALDDALYYFLTHNINDEILFDDDRNMSADASVSVIDELDYGPEDKRKSANLLVGALQAAGRNTSDEDVEMLAYDLQERLITIIQDYNAKKNRSDSSCQYRA